MTAISGEVDGVSDKIGTSSDNAEQPTVFGKTAAIIDTINAAKPYATYSRTYTRTLHAAAGSTAVLLSLSGRGVLWACGNVLYRLGHGYVTLEVDGNQIDFTEVTSDSFVPAYFNSTLKITSTSSSTGGSVALVYAYIS